MTSKIVTATKALNSLNQGAPLCDASAIFEITDSGDWYYRGGKLPLKFSKLFASILHRVEGQYYLITPVEKLKVNVVSEALVIVGYDAKQAGTFEVISSIGTEHELASFDGFTVTDDKIVLQLERGLVAKLNRACFYRFINEFIA